MKLKTLAIALATFFLCSLMPAKAYYCGGYRGGYGYYGGGGYYRGGCWGGGWYGGWGGYGWGGYYGGYYPYYGGYYPTYYTASIVVPPAPQPQVIVIQSK